MIEDEALEKYSGGASESNESKLSIRSNASNCIKLEDLPPARNIPEKKYSVEPDMLTGWRPRARNDTNEKFIIPITTTNYLVDEMVEHIIDKRPNGLKVVYLGPRHLSSYALHQSVCECDPSHKNPYRQNPSFYPKSDRPFIGNNPVVKSKGIEFNSMIESGNLDVAIRKSDTEFDLFMRVDTNTRGHTSWYNFRVKNHSLKGKVRFNIMNFRKQRSLYERNMKPFIKGVKKDGEWKQQGEVISYRESRPCFYEFLSPKVNRRILKSFVLSFNYQFQEEDDEIQIAYCVPYPLSRLTHIIQEIREHEFVEVTTLIKSLGNIDVPLITITDTSCTERKKTVVVTARVHPGESNGSFIAEGLIRALCYDNFLTKKIRREYIFKIIPMLNPDGVIAGNYRTGLMGVDLNRVYDQDKVCYPETVALKRLIKSESKVIQHPIDYYIDLHGHSIKKNTFLYGPEHQLNSNKYNECRILAKCLSNLTSMFRYYSCVWRISQAKSTTARAVFFKKFNISNCYTLQSSNGSYFDRGVGKQKYYDQKSWLELGITLLRGIHDSVQEIVKQKEEIKSMRSKRESRRSQVINPVVNKLDEKQEKYSDDEIPEGDSDSEPEDSLQLDEFLCLRELLLQNCKQQESPKKQKLTFVPFSPPKKYSLHMKARTILTINQEQTKLPVISQPHRQTNLNASSIPKPKRIKELPFEKGLSSKINKMEKIEKIDKIQKPDRMQKIDVSELIEKRKSLREQESGFASIMNRMVLNFNMNGKANVSTKSIHDSQQKPSRYISRSMVMKEPKPTRFIHNLKFQ